MTFEDMTLLARLGMLAFFGALISLYTIYHQTEVLGGFLIGHSFCSFGDTFDCDTVAKSRYAWFLGIPVAAWAFAYYVVFIIIATALGDDAGSAVRPDSDDRNAHPAGASGTAGSPNRVRAAFFLAAASLPPSIGLLLVSHFVIQKLCLLCLMLDLVNVLLFAVSYVALPAPKKPVQDFVDGGKAFFGFLLSLKKKPAQRLWFGIIAGTFYAAVLPAVLTRVYFEPRALARFDAVQLDPLITAWRIAPVESVPLDLLGDPGTKDFSHGPADAKVTIVEFADFECPYCKRTANYLKTIFADKDASVRLVYKSFPLDQRCNTSIKRKAHEFSCLAATLARCAGLQGDDAFWKMHDALVELVDFNENTLNALSEKIGLDKKSIDECVAAGDAERRVVQDVALGQQLRIQSTPTLFINGRRLVLPPDLVPGVVRLIQREVEKR